MEPFTIQALAARVVAQFADDDDQETRYTVRLVPEQVETADGRIMLEDAVEFRTDRMPMMGQDRNEGHHGAVFVGNLTNPRMEDIDGTRWAVADLDWDSDSDAQEFRRMVDEDRLRTVSVDGVDYDVDIVVTERDDDGFATAVRYEFSRFVIGGATIVPFQAMDGSEIQRVASAVDLTAPPAAWFEAPSDGPHRLRVDDSGRVYGWIGTWDSCHLGSPAGLCLTPPRTVADYAYFLTGSVVTSDGTEVPVGQLTMDADHPPLSQTASQATAHYSNSALAVADVAVGEDEHGIWIAGALRPEVTPAQLRRLRASTPSGDWRRLRGNLELVACLMVNTPGHPVLSRVAGGEMQSLVASALIIDEVQPPPAFPGFMDLAEQIGELVAELRLPRQEAEVERLAADLEDE